MTERSEPVASSPYGRLERAVGARLAALVDAVGRRPAPTLALALALAAASLAYTAGHLGVLTDTDALFDESLPFRQLRAELDAAFPALDDNVLVVLDAPTSTGADDAARWLRTRMEAEPELFEHVFSPGAGPFWDEYGLLYLDLDELEELSEALVEVQPFLASLSQDASLRGLFALLDRAVKMREYGPPAELKLAMHELAGALRAVDEGRRAPTLASLLPTSMREKTRRLVVFKPESGLEDGFVPARASLDRLEALGEELSATGVSLRFTGDIALQYEEFQIVQGQAQLAGVVSFALVALILAVGLCSLRHVLATLGALLIGLAWTAGFAALAIGHLNVISVAFAVLFIGLSVDFGIHFCLHYRGLREAGAEHAAALHDTAADVGTSLVLCASTTALGFLAFVPTGYDGVAELGIISAAGMGASLVCSMTVLPALLTLGLGDAPLAPIERLRLRLPSLPVHRPRAVIAATAAIAVAAAWLAPQLRFDANPLRVRDPGARSVQLFEELLAGGEINPWTAEVLAPDLEGADQLAERFRSLASVDRALTLASFVPDEQREKRELLEETAFLLHLAPGEPDAQGVPAEDVRGAALELRRALAEAEADPALGPAARDLGEALEHAFGRGDVEMERVVTQLETQLMVPLRNAVGRLRGALVPGPLTLSDLPPELRVRMQSELGTARVQVFPAGDLMQPGFAEAFVSELRQVSPEVTGISVYMAESAALIVRALQQAFTYAAVGVTLLLWLLWRRVSDTLLVLAPLGLAALWTAAAAVALSIPLNYANVIVLPLLLGIGVDGGIHLVHRHRHGAGSGLLDTPTPRAVVWSALTTIASFGTLGLTSHRGMASLGQLLVLGVTITVLANVVVLPALVTLVEQRRAARGPG